jgi:hypothetical protein
MATIAMDDSIDDNDGKCDDTGSASSLAAGGRVIKKFHLLFVVNSISSYDPWLAIFWNEHK